MSDDGTVNEPVDRALLDFATQIVLEAGDFTLRHFRSVELDVQHKGDGSEVTVADRGAERLLRERIRERFPDDAILGEEEGETAGSSGRRWVIDPIDGTHTFTHGVALFSNLLYLEDEQGPAIGVINIPALGECVAAGRQLGAFLNGERCHVNDHRGLDRATLCASGFNWWDPTMLERLRLSDLAMRTWGDGFGYVLVATGRVEAMVDPVINYWDIAPCQVVIDEAGGRWSAMDGSRDPHAGGFVATNGHIHDGVLSVLNGS